jgi:hypothetical protein
MTQVDVLINVFGKPYQTALSILSLIKYCKKYIDKIYFHLEPETYEIERRDNSALTNYLNNIIILHDIPYWLATEPTDEKRFLIDENYRLSLRYQYGFENTNKKFVLIIH